MNNMSATCSRCLSATTWGVALLLAAQSLAQVPGRSTQYSTNGTFAAPQGVGRVSMLPGAMAKGARQDPAGIPGASGNVESLRPVGPASTYRPAQGGRTQAFGNSLDGEGRVDERTQQKFDRFVAQTIRPEKELSLTSDQHIILALKATPLRVYIANEQVASYQVVSDTEVAILGHAQGRTALTFWFPAAPEGTGQEVLTYTLNVIEDERTRTRIERTIKQLEVELNQNFPDSRVFLSHVGDQIVVRGQAKDIIEAQEILKIVELHARAGSPEREGEITERRFNPVTGEVSELGVPNWLRDEQSAGQGRNTRVVNLLEIPGEQQVMLRVTVAEINRSAVRRFTSNFVTAGSEGVGGSGSFPPRLTTGNTFGVDILDLLAVVEGGTFAVARGDLRLAIDALKQHNIAKTLAEPNLVTMHGRQAQFQAGGRFPVPAGQVGFGSAAQGVDFIPFGVQVAFVPYIVDRDKIRLIVQASVSTRDDVQSVDVTGTNVPGLTSRNFSNTVELRDGQTLAVAGLVQTNLGATSSRIPGLGDLPIVGRIFKSDNTSSDEQELVILITPELVHPVDEDACLPLPGQDLFEPSDAEFYLHGRIESRKSQDYRAAVRTDWARQRRYHRCDDTFIIGPNGRSYGRHWLQSGGSLNPVPSSVLGEAELAPSPTRVKLMD